MIVPPNAVLKCYIFAFVCTNVLLFNSKVNEPPNPSCMAILPLFVHIVEDTSHGHAKILFLSRYEKEENNTIDFECGRIQICRVKRKSVPVLLLACCILRLCWCAVSGG